MPRGYVRTGKNADPEFIRQRAQVAGRARAAQRETVEAALQRIRLASLQLELTEEHRSELRQLAES